MREQLAKIFYIEKKHKGLMVLFAVLLVVGIVGISVAYGAGDGKEEKTIDNLALLSAGNTYCLQDGKIVISYGTGETAVVPLTPDTQNAETYFADKGVYISDEVTALAYSENAAAGDEGETVSVLISGDRGKTWNTYTVPNTGAADYGTKCIGFTTSKDGWLLLAGDAAMGHQENRIFQTADGGRNWTEIGNTSAIYPRVVTGTGFANSEIGFVSFRYDTDVNPVVYRTADKGKTWTQCSLAIPDSFKGITTYATALSPVFDGPNGVLPVVFRNNDWSGDPVDVTVRYETSDYGRTWTFNDKYNLALIWADAWMTRDGRARYEIMDSKMQKEFRARQDSPDNYVIRWSSPWVLDYDVSMDGDQAVITYRYTDSTTSTYKGVERLTFGEENGRTVVTGTKTELEMAEYVDTANWQSVDTGLYAFSIPQDWEAVVSEDGSVDLMASASGQKVGSITVRDYDASQPVSQFEGSQAQASRPKTLDGCQYSATELTIHRVQAAPAQDGTEDSAALDEFHIYLIPDNSPYAYDLTFYATSGSQKAETVAKSISIRTDRVQMQNVARQWARAGIKRNSETQYSLMASSLQGKVKVEDLERQWSSGQSKPWMDGFSVRVEDDNTVEITYTSMTMNGFAGYYQQTLSFSKENGACLVSGFTEPAQMIAQDGGTILAYLDDGKTYLSADTLQQGMFSDLTLAMNGRSKSFLWKTVSEVAFLPELAYADLNGDGQQELISILCQGKGAGTMVEEVHVVSPRDFSEIAVQDPLEALKDRVSSNVDTNGVTVTIDGQQMTFAAKDIAAVVAEQKSWFTNLATGSVIDYDMENGQLVVKVGAQLSPGSFLGDYVLTYVYKDHEMQVGDIRFSASL